MKVISCRILILGFLLLAASPFAVYGAENMPLDEKRLEGLIHAPDFPRHLDWLNTDEPIALSDLRGKIVLLDFWTYCCINCIHVIADLKKLEAKYADQLIVIGVHSAKFTTEKGTDSIRKAILRYGIEHPVINDRDFEVWNQYGVSAWPTLVLINPRGRIIGVQSGEGVYEIFDPLIHQTSQYYETRGELLRDPFPLVLEKAKEKKSVLSFPGKIAADPAAGRLFVADSNHHRILILNEEGTILDQIGSGNSGDADGAFDRSEFRQPQGIILHDNSLLIADTENHLIRRADLSKRIVETVLGTGAQAKALNDAGRGKDVALNSPWDLAVNKRDLYIAMAGAHQIWRAEVGEWNARPYAGSGREARVDGALIASALAQPSGLASDGRNLYVADSETSSLRVLDTSGEGSVDTLIGVDLFEYGDKDGTADQARLQHPLGICWHEGKLYVADTYNSKIKVYDPASKTIATLAGTGVHGLKDGRFEDAQFDEPAGLAAFGSNLFVADTNNHSLRKLDLGQRTVSTLMIRNVDAGSVRNQTDPAPL